MAEQLLDQVRDVVDGQIVRCPCLYTIIGSHEALPTNWILQDFEGQKLAELLATVLLASVGVVSFLVGFFLQNITLALKVGLAGTALTFLVVVPPWPFFNKHPVKWLPIGGGASAPQTHQNIVIDEKMFAQN
ncbi:putative Microsomal signal peptidase 12kDa subunit [Seiridium cardinale]|uniref:Signal peptidase complex subunit 1 n=1 Tax=Seiridium cardinale TaxID=138064 RepID=A0ABR2XFS0_9PEZI